MEIENSELLIHITDSDRHNLKECRECDQENRICPACLFCVGAVVLIIILLVLSCYEIII